MTLEFRGMTRSADAVNFTTVRKTLGDKKPILGLENSPFIKNRERKLLYISPFSALSSRHLSIIGSHGWQIYQAEDISEAEAIYAEQDIPVGIFDIRSLENEKNLLCWERLFLSNLDNKWLALLNKECLTNPKIIELIKHFFYDFHTFPVDSERLMMGLGHAYGMANLKIKSQLELEPHSLPNNFGILGTSPIMKVFYENLYKISIADATVILGGESGTGKELAASAIHKLSQRTNGPFVAVNCGSIPSNLIQSELFGHEKGAYTGADKCKIGKIESAQGGTIFLDEIGDLPIDLQINLVRFLQEQTITRVGSNDCIKVDVRIIAATHVDLEKAVEQGRFREDLYYRLNVLRLNAPRLAERSGDIELLANHFFEKFASEKNPKLKGFSQSALTAIRSYNWPGNVRELSNRVRQAIILSENRLITPTDLGFNFQTSKPAQTLATARASVEEEAVTTAIQNARNNISHAASALDVSRATLYRLMKKYNLDVEVLI